MDKAIKKKWLRALRSGKYKQTRTRLRSRNGAMCCLGVLCEIQGAEWEYDAFRVVDNYAIKGTEERYYLPRKYLAGLSETQEKKLSRLNDGDELGKPLSFKEIADYIEKNL